jgi:1,4-alpha-glucan branching enzyme
MRLSFFLSVAGASLALCIGCDGAELSGTGGHGAGGGAGGSPQTTSTTSSSGGGTTGSGGTGGGGAWTPAFGASLDGTGVVFSVWAPHATAAWVAGDFPGGKVAMEAKEKGTFLVRVEGAGAGTKYHFTLDSPLGLVDRLDPYCRQKDGADCVVIDAAAHAFQNASFQRPARQAAVVYEMHVGSFAVPDGAAQGTFASTKDRLAQLADLGVNVVELMPVQSFGGSATGWGYNPELYFAPKTSYGGAADLQALVDEAHGLGIAVWLDVVANHYTGNKAAPLRCFDGQCDGDAGIYFFGQGPYQSTPWGPRPAYATQEVAAMFLDSVRWWLLDQRGDGFRWDSTSNIRAIDGQGTTPGGKELLVAANNLIHDLSGTSVAEDLKGYDAITVPADKGGFGFDAQWDGFSWAVTGELAKASDDARDLGAIQGALTGSYAGDRFARLLFLEDHDTVGNGGARLPVKIDSANPESFAARKRSMLGGVLLFTAPGVPMLFMGEESLATAAFTDPPKPLAAPTAAGLKMQAFYRDLLHLRRDAAGDSGGLADTDVEIVQRNDPAKVIAYRRHGASGQDVLVIVNLRNKAHTEYDVGVPDAGPWRVRLDTDWKQYGDDFGGGQQGSITAFPAQKDGKNFAVPLKLAAYGAMILTH